MPAAEILSGAKDLFLHRFLALVAASSPRKPGSPHKPICSYQKKNAPAETGALKFLL